MPSLKETSLEAPAPVRAVANAVAQYVDRLGTVWVEGQITQLSRRAGVGTVFLTLRDPVADVSVPVTCRRAVFDALPSAPAEGMRVVVWAKPSYYVLRGSFSLEARDIRMIGLGELLARLERRRQLLAAEGLFAAELKRPLPFLPGTIGLVTAVDSAAERDVLEVARRRWPAVRFRVVHAAMQGPRAAAEVITALERLDRDPEVEVVVVARGGGSVEDLLPFSDEALVRAVSRARTPVVSAIGHEPDTPLLDLVADLRAATPTDAAKRVVPDVAEEVTLVVALRARARRLVEAQVTREQAGLDTLRGRPALADPRSLIDGRQAEIAQLTARSRRTVAHCLDRAADEAGSLAARARALSPLATLQRGYAVVLDAAGGLVTSATAVAVGDPVSVRVADGQIAAAVTGTRSDNDTVEHTTVEESTDG